MSTLTPRTNELYLRHANYCDQEQADEAIEDFRDLASTLEHELAAEQAKVRLLRNACDQICEEWGMDHDANPIGAGQRMATRASRALEATESENGGSNE